jgi:hypothetical protein
LTAWEGQIVDCWNDLAGKLAKFNSQAFAFIIDAHFPNVSHLERRALIKCFDALIEAFEPTKKEVVTYGHSHNHNRGR